MEAIVLAGGRGTRLGSITADTPKPMLTVGSRPFLSYLLDYLMQQGIQRVLLSVGYLHDQFEQHFGNRYRELELEYVIEAQPLGTGGGIRQALLQTEEDELLVLNGDTLFLVPLGEMLAFHRDRDALLTIALKPLADSGRYGQVVVDDGRIVSFREKEQAGPGLINGGVYVLQRQAVLARMPEGVFSLESDFLAQAVTRETIGGYVSDAYFIDIGLPGDLEKAGREIEQFIQTHVVSNDF